MGLLPSEKEALDHSRAQQRIEGHGNKTLRRHAYSCSQSSTTNNVRQVHTDVTSKQFHLEWGTKQGDPLSTLLFNPLQQYNMKPLTEKWNRGNHGVRLAEQDHDANFSNLRFADDILLMSGSLKHTTTALHELTNYTPRRQKSFPTRRQKNRKNKKHGYRFKR